LRESAQAVVDALCGGQVPALLSGLDILGPWTNQIAGAEGDILLVADRGAGEVVQDALLGLIELVVCEPSVEQVSLLSMRSGAPGVGPAVVVRERSLSDRELADGQCRRRAEDAWIDLVAEARRGWPIGTGELAAILRAMAVDGPSWTHLARACRRRNMPAELDPDRSMPLRLAPADRFWAALGSDLEAGA
jgi:hypothetical protein